MPRFRNEGGPVTVVELGRDIQKGEEFTGSAVLADVHGFVLVEDKKKKADPPKDDEE